MKKQGSNKELVSKVIETSTTKDASGVVKGSKIVVKEYCYDETTTNDLIWFVTVLIGAGVAIGLMAVRIAAYIR